MPRSTSYEYNEATGQWVERVTNTSDKKDKKDKKEEATQTSSDNLTSTDTNSNSATGEAEKEANDIDKPNRGVENNTSFMLSLLSY